MFVFSRILIIAFITTLLFGCSKEPNKPIKILSNSWVGYTPLFYAKEKGWLKELNIEVTPVVSLGESLMAFQTSQFDGLTGTQYEYEQLVEKNHNITPIMMFDRSNGGDMVMSNQTIQGLQNSEQPIKVYLELESINSLLFKDFIRAHHLEGKAFEYSNFDQVKNINLIKKSQAISQPAIVITYIPYNFELQSLGFHTIASTHDLKDILVVDALYVKKKTLNKYPETFVKLKLLLDQALINLQQNPKEYYDTVKGFIENPTYEEFTASLNDIEWINTGLSSQLKAQLNQHNFPQRDLIQ